MKVTIKQIKKENIIHKLLYIIPINNIGTKTFNANILL